MNAYMDTCHFGFDRCGIWRAEALRVVYNGNPISQRSVLSMAHISCIILKQVYNNMSSDFLVLSGSGTW